MAHCVIFQKEWGEDFKQKCLDVEEKITSGLFV